MANKTTGNFIGVSDDYASTSGAWSITEARERRLSSTHATSWGVPTPFDMNFLVIAGGGGGGNVGQNNYDVGGGGGAGGYLNSYGTEPSGGNTTSLSGLNLRPNKNFTVTVGAGGASNANGANSVFSGLDSSSAAFNHTATGGGRGAGDQAASSGGSGGGGGWQWSRTRPTSQASDFDGESGTANQGTDGADNGGALVMNDAALCGIFQSEFWCYSAASDYCGGGGGGAGAAAPAVTTDPNGGSGGNGLASSITGSSVTRAGGGGGEGHTSGSDGSGGTGASAAGGGGQPQSAGQDGVVILRYPNTLTINFNPSQLTGTTATDGTDKVTTFTAGSGSIYWSES